MDIELTQGDHSTSNTWIGVFCTFRKVEHWSLLKFIGFIPSYANLVVYECIINGYYDLCLFL